MEDIIQSRKICGEQQPNEIREQMMFPLDLNVIKKFELIAGVAFDYSKFKTRMEFQQYFKDWLK